MANDSIELQQMSRRMQLQQYARQELSGPNQAQAFINIVAKAVDLVGRQSANATELIEDIQQVLIGTGMLDKERGTGPYFVGNPNSEYNGASGFKPEFQPDLMFQVQHAAAGLVIGYKYGLVGEGVAHLVEEEPQDDALYSATIPIGQWLAKVSVPYEIADPVTEFVLEAIPFNTPLFYEQGDACTVLPRLLLDSICDGSCELPSDEDLRIHTSDASGDGFPDTSILVEASTAGSAGHDSPHDDAPAAVASTDDEGGRPDSSSDDGGMCTSADSASASPNDDAPAAVASADDEGGRPDSSSDDGGMCTSADSASASLNDDALAATASTDAEGGQPDSRSDDGGMCTSADSASASPNDDALRADACADPGDEQAGSGRGDNGGMCIAGDREHVSPEAGTVVDADDQGANGDGSPVP